MSMAFPFLASLVGKQPQRNKSIWARVLEHDADELAQRFAIGFEPVGLGGTIKRIRSAAHNNRLGCSANAR